MRIRSITYFIDPALGELDNQLSITYAHSRSAQIALEKAGFEVQSIRLATSPFPTWLPLADKQTSHTKIEELAVRAEKNGFDYLALGPCSFHTNQEVEALIPRFLSIAESIFITMPITADHRISLQDIYSSARVIKHVAALSENGFGNLRFAALANVAPFTPFFPAAYGAPGETAFAIAMECADSAIAAFQAAADIRHGCQNLLAEFEKKSAEIENIFPQLDNEYNLQFKGFDFSLAPFPEEWCSFGKALESMGVPAIGSAGSLAAASILAGTLDQGTWRKTGFNGLMMPILEDAVLAQRSGDGILSVYDVLQYSSVCGTGLDTVPLPGDIPSEKIAALLLDIAALSVRLDKPLTARLMPIPGKAAGEEIEFDFSFFSKGKVLDFPYRGIQAPLNVGDYLAINPRQTH